MNKVSKKIADEISCAGPISFARFMDLALYCPDYGYYEKIEDRIGRGGDYYTSVSVGALFGKLLAAQFTEWQQLLTPAPLTVIEGGAHHGHFAEDTLRFLRTHHSNLFAGATYVILEPSPARRALQRERLSDFAAVVRWADGLHTLEHMFSGGIQGIVFCNELLDALPFRRWQWNKSSAVWTELGVGFGSSDQSLCWQRLEGILLSFPELFPYLEQTSLKSMLEGIPDGFVYDEPTGANHWWITCGSLLHTGWMVAIDYGLETEGLLERNPSEGSLRGYRNHQIVPHLLNNPGDQDITGHINFSDLRARGAAVGLKTISFESQSRFLSQIVARILRKEIAFEEWNQQHTRQFQTLAHPELLGSPFKVLVQAKNVKIDAAQRNQGAVSS